MTVASWAAFGWGVRSGSWSDKARVTPAPAAVGLSLLAVQLQQLSFNKERLLIAITPAMAGVGITITQLFRNDQ